MAYLAREEEDINQLEFVDVAVAIVGAAASGYSAYTGLQSQKRAEKDAKKQRAFELTQLAKQLEAQAQQQIAIQQNFEKETKLEVAKQVTAQAQEKVATRKTESIAIPMAIAGGVVLLGVGAIFLLRR